MLRELEKAVTNEATARNGEVLERVTARLKAKGEAPILYWIQRNIPDKYQTGRWETVAHHLTGTPEQIIEEAQRLVPDGSWTVQGYVEVETEFSRRLGLKSMALPVATYRSEDIVVVK